MFFETVQELCLQKGISVDRLAREVGIYKSNFTNWKNGSTPGVGKVAKIAAYFGVSADYLLTGTREKRPPAEAGGLTDVEMEILKIFRNLPEDKKRVFMTVARALKAPPTDT
jgi:transcriptional regulator with XRE-family HTH domain